MADKFLAEPTIVLAQAEPHGAAPHAAGTETPGHAAAQSDFPPFDPQYWAPQIIWLAIVFGALYLLMSRIALPRVSGILEMRRAKIEGDLATAHKARADADLAAAAHDKQLADARAKAQETAQQTQARLTAEGDAKRKALEADLNAKLAAAETQIAATKTRAMTNVEEIARDTATAIVEHITGTPADRNRIAAAVTALKGA
jgi:F-type H+-transporting ATPase subunit b